ncbi:hypothetical protein AAC387_Pa03g3595 [Persea americana]
MFYGAVVWDPWIIVAQIVCLQCLYYIALGVFLSILVGVRLSRMSLVYFFDYSTVTASTVTGWCIIASFLLSALVGAGSMIHLIRRAKKVARDSSPTIPFSGSKWLTREALVEEGGLHNFFSCDRSWLLFFSNLTSFCDYTGGLSLVNS